MRDTGFRIIQNRVPMNKWIAPYVHILAKETGGEVLSGYRGSRPPAPAILHAHHLHDQAELVHMHKIDPLHYAPANQPGGSTHEDFSDGVVYPGIPYGHRLDWYGEGWDMNGADQARAVCELASRRYGWDVFQPYTSGSELHHCNFRRKPKPGRELIRIHYLRARLPRR